MQSVRDRDRSPPPPTPLGMWMMSHGHCPRGGGACECPRVGCFSIFRRADDVTRTMSKGGGACECLHPPPPFRKSCRPTRACIVFHPSKFRPPPPPGWLATGLYIAYLYISRLPSMSHRIGLCGGHVGPQ